MKKSTVKRTMAFALAAAFLMTALLVAGCSCRTYRRDTFDYNDIKYERIDYDALEAAFEEANSLVNGNYISLVNASNNAVGYLNTLIGDYQYVYVEYAKDTEAWRDEFTWISNAYSQATSLYYELLYNVLQSSNADRFFSGWSEEEKQLIVQRHEAMDDEYLALQTEITRLETEYNAIDTDDQKEYADEAAEILIDLVAAYNKLAAAEGYDNYMEYAYENDYGRSYSPEDAERLCGYVKQYLAPLSDDVDAAISRASGASRAAAANGLASPLSANYTDYVALSENVLRSYFEEIGDYMTEAYDYLNECNLYYQATAANNPNGLTGAFTTFLYNNDAPYIYQYCSDNGSWSDISTFVHEFGHFTSYYVNGSSGGSDLDVAEIQSQANEMLFLPYYEQLFTNADALVMNELFSSLFWSVTMGCIFDEFQREIYTSPESYATADDINALFDRLLEEYNAEWYATLYESKYSYDFTYWWAEVSHTFQSPFYYISYAVSALPALTIYEDSKTDRAAAIAEYNYIQQYGNGTYTFGELLNNAGVASPFTESTLRSLADFIESEIAA